MNKTILALTMAASLLGCSEDDEGRSTARLSEIERIDTAGSTTTIERLELRYDGSKLSQVNAYRNGAPNGTARVTYQDGRLARVDFADKDGDRSFQTLTYLDGYLWKTHYGVTGVTSTDATVWYDEATAMVKEQAFASTRAGVSMPMTWVQRYEYDANQRLEKIAVINGGTTLTSDIRYNVDGTIERSSSFQGATHNETWDFRYLPDGRVDEITDTRNGSTFVSYGQNGLISEIRELQGSTSSTYRYTYEEGSVSGLSFAPAFPVAGQFDLAGKSYSDLALLHSGVPIQADIPRASGSDDGGSACFVSNGSSCDNCLVNNCCDSCTTSTCDDYSRCAIGCDGSSSCLSYCDQQYPGNIAFAQCASSYCSSTCQ